jgi:hypothetical protein
MKFSLVFNVRLISCLHDFLNFRFGIQKDPICKYVLWTPGERHGKRSVGRPHTLYHQYIGKLINSETPPTASEMRNVARSGTPDLARKSWKKFVTDLKPALFDAD